MKLNNASIAFLTVLVIMTALYWGGLSSVPFHPDESTYIYMSTEVERFIRQPQDRWWQAEQQNDPRQLYRLLNPPLVHYTIEAARVIAGLPPITTDWDWGKTWEENAQAGALPDPRLLLAARAGIAIFYPFSVLLIFLVGKQIGGDITGWVSALLMATNALVVLHTRRAMAEGIMLFTISLTLWVFLKAEKRPWLAAIPAALAFCAKHSLAALAPLGIIVILWNPYLWEPRLSAGRRLARFTRQAVFYGILYAAVVLLLNPFLWKQPVQAVRTAVQARQVLASNQVYDRQEQALDTPARKLIGLVGSLYLTPPIFAESANYQDATLKSEAAYLRNPLNHLFRSVIGGGTLFTLTLFGMVLAVKNAARRNTGRREIVLLLSASLFLALALLLAVPLAWQRYYLPLVPFCCLLIGYGIKELLSGVHLRKEVLKEAQ